MAAKKNLKIRPYARLLTMLGDQLIKNERIALIELIKNAYDADSPWVRISFDGFGEEFEIYKDSKIVIEDAGDGMDVETIQKHWLNPATPEKKQRKAKKTRKGRIIQGEKGIGRFAMLKLGRKISIVTRARGEDREHVIDYDFSRYDDEFLTEDGEEKELFIGDLDVSLESRRPQVIRKGRIHLGTRARHRPAHGTRMEISDLKGSWSDAKAEKVYGDVTRLQSIFSGNGSKPGAKHREDFEVWIYKDDQAKTYHRDYEEKLNILLKDRCVFEVAGGYEEEEQVFRFELGGKEQAIELRDPGLAAFRVFADYFGKKGEVLDKRGTACGSFRFHFFVFDFSSKAPAKYQLDKEDKQLIREHRIYLYRDGIRVYPYGEPDDDWLRIDMYRGTIAAGHFLSNDQVVGYVDITHKDNPKLKDKTNREGLIEEGDAAEDFIALLQVFLAYIRSKPYGRYRAGLEARTVQEAVATDSVRQMLGELKEAVETNRKASGLAAKLEKTYKAERQYLVRRAEITEELAGVGLSVETASHDIMAIMGKALISLDGMVRDVMHDDLDQGALEKELQSLRGMLSFIEAQLKDIQLLFKSSKQRRRNLKVKEIFDKVEHIYQRILKKEGIALSGREVGPPVIAKTTDAVLLQLLINLFDNAIYWLGLVSRKRKRIEVLLDGDRQQLIFADNGPGVDEDDAPYIFEAFYSGKGEEGRGLGLYIARRLLERNDYSIDLAELKSEKILPGASFVVNFVSED